MNTINLFYYIFYFCYILTKLVVFILQYTKQYTGLFNEAGLMPKRILARFMVSPEAAIQPGTPLYASHFRPGDFVDIRGTT